jgi:hypothetical protein
MHLRKPRFGSPFTKRIYFGLSPLLQLPAELRLQIYMHVGIPLVSAPCNLSGLFLSCKTIHSELDTELAKRATRVLDAHLSSDMRLVDSSCLQRFNDVTRLNITVGLPSWMLFRRSDTETVKMLRDLSQLMSLYLHTLTLQIYEAEEPSNGNRHVESSEQHGSANNHITPSTHNTQIRWSDVAPFAMRLNCLICPKLCSGKRHFPIYSFCTHQLLSPRKPRLRKLIFELEKLQPEINISPIFYPLGVVALPPTFDKPYGIAPDLDGPSLRRFKWYHQEDAERMLDGMPYPSRMVWEKRVAVGALKRSWQWAITMGECGLWSSAAWAIHKLF